jgi:hypothetical protein
MPNVSRDFRIGPRKLGGHGRGECLGTSQGLRRFDLGLVLPFSQDSANQAFSDIALSLIERQPCSSMLGALATEDNN